MPQWFLKHTIKHNVLNTDHATVLPKINGHFAQVYIFWYHCVRHDTIHSQMLFLSFTCIYFQYIGYKNAMTKKNYENSFAESVKKWNSREYTGIHSMNIVKNNILNTCYFVLTTMYLHFTMYDCHKNQFMKFPDFFPTKLEYNFRDQMKDLVAGSIPPKSLLFHFSVMFF